jgi:hypothetical protein
MIIQRVLGINYDGGLVHNQLSIQLLWAAIWKRGLEILAEYVELILGILFHILLDLLRSLNGQMLRDLGSQSFLDSNESVRIIVVDVYELTLIEFIFGYMQSATDFIEVQLKFISDSCIILKDCCDIRL